MRKTMLMLAVFGLAGSLWAADPIIGTWKLNIAKSTFSPNVPAVKENTDVYREIEGGQIELTYTATEKDGSATLLKLTWPVQGGMAKVLQGDPAGTTWVETLIAPGEWYATYLRDGKQFQTRHKAISKDGKTMRQTLRGFDAQGKPFELLLVSDRQ